MALVHDTPGQAATTSQRMVFLDVLKGFGIILVVFGHALRGILPEHLISWSLFQAIDTRIYAFHMPLFFVISGLFLGRTMQRDPPSETLKRLILRLIYPLVLWTYIFFAVKLMAGVRTNMPVTMSDFPFPPFPGYEHLWFPKYHCGKQA